MRCPWLIGAALLAAACAGEEMGSPAQGGARPLVTARGDQLHPAMGGDFLVWLDLSDDPNGACFVPSYCHDGECDGTCASRVKSMDLRSGEVRELSNEIGWESAPALSDSRALWRCQDAGGRGLCVSPLDRDEQRFLEDVGWDDYTNDLTRRPAVSGETVVWARFRYDYGDGDLPFQLVMIDLDTGVREALLALDRFPAEVALAGRQAAFISTSWQDDGYHSRLETLDLDTRERRVVLDTRKALFGLAADGDRLAWKEGTRQEWEGGENEVHVAYLDGAGEVRRADGPEALVSEESGVVMGEGKLYWLDYREGPYRLAAADLATGAEELVTPEDAVLGAFQLPAAAGDRLVWPDLRGDDWDLYLLEP